MNPEAFHRIVKQCKPSALYSGTIESKLKVTTDSEQYKHLFWRIKDEKGLGVEFMLTKPKRITIFEASLMYATFVLKKRMRDEGNFFKCVAGREFCENIETIVVIEPLTPVVMSKRRVLYGSVVGCEN